MTSADIIFDLDSSGSVSEANFYFMIELLMQVVDNLNVIDEPGQTGDQVMIILIFWSVT